MWETAYVGLTQVFFEPEESIAVEKVLEEYAASAISVCEGSLYF